MKDYSLNKDSAKEFILSYEIMGKQIIVSYANDGVDVIPYSIQAEKEILEKMKYQVLGSKSFYSTFNNKFEIFLKLFLDEVLLFLLFGIAVFNMKISLIASIMGAFIFPVLIGLTGYKLNCYRKIRNDIKKQYLFLNNEDSLNLTIRNNPNVTRGLDENLRRRVLVDKDNNFSFTLNTIENIGYKELRDVYGYVDSVIKGNVPKVLRKRRFKRKKDI